MKNNEIHDGLDKKEIRDFLAKEFNKVPCSGNIEEAQKELSEAQKRLDGIIKRRVIERLISDNKWNIFDISDDIEDYKPGTFFQFVGTEEEYKKLMINIKGTSGEENVKQISF